MRNRSDRVLGHYKIEHPDADGADHAQWPNTLIRMSFTKLRIGEFIIGSSNEKRMKVFLAGTLSA